MASPRDGFWKDFRSFVMRGNVIDLAIAVVMGAAFGKVVDSFVKDVLMPPLGLLLGKVDFANLFVVLKAGTIPGPYHTLGAAQAAGAVTIAYGQLLNTIVSFVLIAFAVFLIIKALSGSRQPAAAVKTEPSEDIVLLREIRDELRLRDTGTRRTPGGEQSEHPHF